MKSSNAEMENRIRNLTNEELVEMIENKSDQYVESAMNIARTVAEERGGINSLRDELKLKKDNDEAEIKRQQEEKMELSRLAAQQRIQKEQKAERQKLSDASKSNYTSSYGTTRLIAQIVASIGWITVLISCIVLLATIGSASQSRYGFQWLGLLPAFGGILIGIYLVMSGQVTRAVVDNSDNTGEILALLNKELKK